MTRSELLQEVVRSYRDAGQPWPTASVNVSAWAVDSGLLRPRPADVIKQFASEISRAMREEYITDPQGREVRAKHVARVRIGGRQTAL